MGLVKKRDQLSRLLQVISANKALELTETGSELMQRAIRLGYLGESALATPYNNLASMYRQIGATRKAIEYEKMATKLDDATRLR